MYIYIYIYIYTYLYRARCDFSVIGRQCDRCKKKKFRYKYRLDGSRWVECFGYLLLGCSVISASFIICMLTLLLMPLAVLHFCVGLDFVTPPCCNLFLSKHHHHFQVSSQSLNCLLGPQFCFSVLISSIFLRQI
jgi:hypothetical protein